MSSAALNIMMREAGQKQKSKIHTIVFINIS